MVIINLNTGILLCNSWGKKQSAWFLWFFPSQGEHELDHGSWHQPRQEEAEDWNLVAYGCIFRETKAIECKGTRLAYKMVPTLLKMEFEWIWGGSYRNFILKFYFCNHVFSMINLYQYSSSFHGIVRRKQHMSDYKMQCLGYGTLMHTGVSHGLFHTAQNHSKQIGTRRLDLLVRKAQKRHRCWSHVEGEGVPLFGMPGDCGSQAPELEGWHHVQHPRSTAPQLQNRELQNKTTQ